MRKFFAALLASLLVAGPVYADFSPAPGLPTSAIPSTIPSTQPVCGTSASAVQGCGASTVITGASLTVAGKAMSPYAADAIFGTGADGTVTISSGTTTLTRDMYFANLTINGTGKLALNGYHLSVSNVLDISAAPAGAISNYGANTTVGNASGATGGSYSNTIAATGSVPSALGGAAGPNGTTAAGTSGGNVGGYGNVFGGSGGFAGTGGAGTNAGGAVGIVSVAHLFPTMSPINPSFLYLPAFNLITSGTAGANAGAGGGDGTNPGGGAGASGIPGGWVVIAARFINRGAGTAVGAITAAGLAGGNGGTVSTGNVGGGGGAGGGGGGGILLTYEALSGTTATNALDASGGAGGAGGNGAGTGKGGNGGSGGNSGNIQVTSLSAPSTTVSAFNVAGTAGSTTATTTGASGGAGATLQVSL
jgi:hypothetical protein